MTETDDYRERIDRLARKAREEKRRYDTDTDEDTDEERASRYLREGFGPTVALYVELRTGGRMAPFSPDEFDELELAMNNWLELYARCYDEELKHDFSVREAAELLVETRNIHDVAEILTRVP